MNIPLYGQVNKLMQGPHATWGSKTWTETVPCVLMGQVVHHGPKDRIRGWNKKTLVHDQGLYKE